MGRRNDSSNESNRPPRRSMSDRALEQWQQQHAGQLQEIQNAMQAVPSIYGGLRDYLQPMYGDYSKASGSIVSELQSQLAGLQGLLNVQGMPTAETAAGKSLFGALGAGGLQTLAGQQQRGLDWMTSAQREAGLASRSALGNLIKARQDIYAQQPYELNLIQDELRREALERKLAMSQMANDEAMANWIMGQIGQVTARPGKPGPGGGKPGGTTTEGTTTTTSEVPPQIIAQEGWRPDSPAPSSLVDYFKIATSIEGLPQWLQTLIRQSWERPGSTWSPRGTGEQVPARLETPYRQTEFWQTNVANRPARRKEFNQAEQELFDFLMGLPSGGW